MKIKKRGFTLIELLVVIAIIGVLSAIILFSVANAKINALDSARRQKVIQWRNALELFRTSNNNYYPNNMNYPFPSGSTGNGTVLCVGQKYPTTCNYDWVDYMNMKYPNEIQVPGTIQTDSAFTSDMNNFIKSTDSSDVQISNNLYGGTSGSNMQGIMYKCIGGISQSATNNCTEYVMQWAFSNSKNCAPGTTITTGTTGASCFYDSKNQ